MDCNNYYALVVDDHPLFARGVADFLKNNCGYHHVHPLTKPQGAIDYINVHGNPDIIILDFWLSDGASSLELLCQLQMRCNSTKFLMISGDDDSRIAQKIQASGVHGYLRKDEPPEKMLAAIEEISNGGVWFSEYASLPKSYTTNCNPTQAINNGLTPRQEEVLSLILRGLPNKRIASALNLSEQTVKEHITCILSKLGVRNRIEVITLFHRKPLL